MSEEVVWRTGMLFKKGMRRGILGRANWKPRYLVLTSTSIKYFKVPGGTQRGVIDLTQCTPQDIHEMPSDAMKTGHSSSSIWRIAIQTPGRRYFIAADSFIEMHSWYRDLIEISKKGQCHYADVKEQERMAGRRAVMRVHKQPPVLEGELGQLPRLRSIVC